MKALLGVKYFMTINKLLVIKNSLGCGQCVGNELLCQQLDLNKYYEFYILRITKMTKKLTGPIKLDLWLATPMTVFWSVSPMIPLKPLMNTFTGRSIMKEYMKNKSIKWRFKFCYCCASKTGYLYQFDLYVGKK